jgi:D-inositol-3-phosphate glycosyltransferase
LISFIWSPGNPLPAGTGGSENYTIGQVRELTRRGIAAQVVTVGLGHHDGRDGFADIPFLSLPTLATVSELDDTVVFVNEAHTTATRHPAFLILHNPPPIRERYRAFAVDGTRELTLIATSRYAAALWADYLDVDVATIAVVYPFAEPGFAAQPRPVHEAAETRVLFAGRLSPEKGIYTLLETLHLDIIEQHPGLTFTATTAGADKPQGKIIERLLDAHPGISVVGSRKTPAAMAALMARHDIVVIPSNSQYWHETFGIVSIEAQHAACRRPTAARSRWSGRTTPRRSPGASSRPPTGGRFPRSPGGPPGRGSPSGSPLTRCSTCSPDRSRSRPRSSSGSSRS